MVAATNYEVGSDYTVKRAETSLPGQAKEIAKETREHKTNPGISPDGVQGCLA